jgi:hypothetical protein
VVAFPSPQGVLCLIAILTVVYAQIHKEDASMHRNVVYKRDNGC